MVGLPTLLFLLELRMSLSLISLMQGILRDYKKGKADFSLLNTVFSLNRGAGRERV